MAWFSGVLLEHLHFVHGTRSTTKNKQHFQAYDDEVILFKANAICEKMKFPLSWETFVMRKCERQKHIGLRFTWLNVFIAQFYYVCMLTSEG